MLGLPADFLQMESFLKFGQDNIIKEEELDIVSSLTDSPGVCIRCQNFYEQNGYLNESSACVECLKYFEDVSNEATQPPCRVCSLEECTCQTVYQCAYCPDSFPSTLLLQKHTFIHCADTGPLNLPIESNGEPSTVTSEVQTQDETKECPFCHKQFEMFDPARHSCTARYICHLCGAALSSAYNLKIHIMKHSGELPYKCEMCTKTFSKPSELTRHLGVHSGIKPTARPGVKSYPCTVCSKTFTRPADLRRHSLTHSGTRPFACTMCGLAFSDTSNLKKHITIHTKGDQPFIDLKTYHCSYCNKMFSRPSELKRHFTTHTKTIPFSCEFCGLAFGDASNLNKHIQTHAKTGLRECIMCQASFDSFEELETHVANHPSRLADEPIDCVKCDICGKTFSSDMYLTAHRAGHTEARPFPCTECLKTFKSLSHLKNHMLTHTGAKGQVCTVCGKAFLTKSSLRRHEAIHSRTGDQRYIHHQTQENVQTTVDNKSSSPPATTWGDFPELKSPDISHSQDMLDALADPQTIISPSSSLNVV